MKQIQRHLGTVTAFVLLGILTAAIIFSFTALKHKPQTVERTFQSVLPTPTTEVSTTATPNQPKKDSKDVVVTVVPPEIAPAVLTEPTLITKHPAPRSELAVDGNYVVWRSYEDSQTNVVAYNVITKDERRLSSLSGGKASLRVSGNYVVWEDTLQLSGRVVPTLRVYDLRAGKELTVSPTENPQAHPDISGDLVVWADGRNSHDDCVGDIYSYDLRKKQELPIIVRPGCQSFPRTNGAWVIYLDWPVDAQLRGRYPDQPTVHAYHVGTGEDINLGQAVWQNDAWSSKRHLISGQIVVWKGGDGMTHLYDLAARRERVVAEPKAYDDLILNGRMLRVGSQLYNVATGQDLSPFHAIQAKPASLASQIDGVATDGQTFVWVFDSGNEGLIYVARLQRLP
jgi:beta propeller repeat protein